MDSKVLVKGVCVSPGIVRSTARVVNHAEDMDMVQPGDVLVLPNSHPMYAIAVMNASAVVCENGGMLSHICIVAMEMGIPCITQAVGATSKITSGQSIFIDAGEGAVYANE